MKQIILKFSLLILILSLAGCYGLNDKEIYGELTLNPKSGWSALNFTDPKTKKPFELVNGKYRLQYNVGFHGWRLPTISVFNSKNELLGNIEIPKDSLNRDGSYEIYRGGNGNNNSFNILGGRRKVITEKVRFAKDNVSCTYTVSVPCTTTDSNGNTVVTTCTETRNGDQDVVYSKNTFYNTYRILFDGQDLVNVGVFRASSPVQTETVELDSTSCG